MNNKQPYKQFTYTDPNHPANLKSFYENLDDIKPDDIRYAIANESFKDPKHPANMEILDPKKFQEYVKKGSNIKPDDERYKEAQNLKDKFSPYNYERLNNQVPSPPQNQMTQSTWNRIPQPFPAQANVPYYYDSGNNPFFQEPKFSSKILKNRKSK